MNEIILHQSASANAQGGEWNEVLQNSKVLSKSMTSYLPSDSTIQCSCLMSDNMFDSVDMITE